MRSILCKSTVILFGFYFSVGAAFAKQPSGTQFPYLQEIAREILKKVSETHGFYKGIAPLQNITVTLEGSDRWLGQGASPENPTRVRYYHQNKIHDFENNRFYSRLKTRNEFENTWCSQNVLSASLSYAFDCLSGKYQSYDLSNRPEIIENIVAEFPEPRQYIENALNRIETVRWEKQTNERGQKVDIISFFDTDSARWELSIDSDHYLVRKVSGPITPVNNSSYVAPVIERTYSDYRKINDLYIPFDREKLFGTVSPFESRYTALRMSEIAFNSIINDSLFKEPGHIIEDKAQPALPWTHTEVQEGVHLIEKIQSNYNSAFVEFEDYVVLFDAPIDNHLSEKLITKIDSITAGKPIKYVIASHFHYDHIGGLNAFTQKGATVIAPHQISRFLEKFVGDSNIKQVENYITIGKGTKRIVIYAMKDNPHSEGMLFTYIPNANAVIVADLFWKEDTGQLRPARLQARHFFKHLQKINGNVTTLIPIHGPIGTMDDVRNIMTLLESQYRIKDDG